MRQPSRQFATAEQIGGTVVWLCSPYAIRSPAPPSVWTADGRRCDPHQSGPAGGGAMAPSPGACWTGCWRWALRHCRNVRHICRGAERGCPQGRDGGRRAGGRAASVCARSGSRCRYRRFPDAALAATLPPRHPLLARGGGQLPSCQSARDSRAAVVALRAWSGLPQSAGAGDPRSGFLAGLRIR